MSSLLQQVGRALSLKPGEGRQFAVLTAYVFVATAVAILLSSAKNGLFLAVYPSELVPWAMIGAALVAAIASVAVSGIMPRFPRRTLADGLAAFVVLSLAASWAAYTVDPTSSFVLFIALSALQVLVVTHTWDYASSLFTGRQAKRLMPLVGMGASLGALSTGFAVAPLAGWIGTPNLLFVASGLLLATLPILRLVEEPEWTPVEESGEAGPIRAFVHRSGEGLRSVRGEPLLRVLALSAVLLVLANILIDFQFKVALQDRFGRDRITAIYGLVFGATGTGALLLQLFSSRVLIPRIGISNAALGHAGIIATVAGGLAMWGGFWLLAGLQVLDDVLRHGIERPVEQVSLLPFPPRIKTAAHTTLYGVLRPLTEAAGGGIALLLVARPELLPWTTAAAAAGALFVLRKHPHRYLEALERALARHTLEFSSWQDVPLIVDSAALDVIDRGLADEDPTVVVFALGLLKDLPPEEAFDRAMPLLEHPVNEVRAEAAIVLGEIRAEGSPELREALAGRLESDTSPLVISAVIDTMGRWRSADGAGRRVASFVDHEDAEVRRAALVALCRLEREWGEERLEALLDSSDPDDRAAAIRAVGELGWDHLLAEVARAVHDPHTRPAAIRALHAVGPAALPVLESLVGRSELALSTRRRLVTTLAAIDEPGARDVLVDLVRDPDLGPAALTSLRRLRNEGKMEALELAVLRPLLRSEVRKGLRFGLVAGALERRQDGARPRFAASELRELRNRAVYRSLAVLSLGYDPGRLSMVESNLFSSDASVRSNALELLDGIVESEDGALVMPLAESVGDPTSLTDAEGRVPDGGLLRERPVEALLQDPDPWPRALGVYAVSGDDPDPDLISEEDRAMIPLIEKVMLLKGSELFRTLPGEELAGIAELADERYFEEDEVIFREGDRGDAFYMVVQGAVRISREGRQLAVLGSREGFGEMAILDQESRSATATATETTTLLRIGRDDFDRLVEANPAVARGIYRVLTQRLRSTLAKVAAG